MVALGNEGADILKRRFKLDYFTYSEQIRLLQLVYSPMLTYACQLPTTTENLRFGCQQPGHSAMLLQVL